MTRVETSSWIRCARTLVGLLAPMAVVLSACGDSPTAPEESTPLSVAGVPGQSLIAFSPESAMTAGKIAGDGEVVETSKRVRPNKRATLKIKTDGWRAALRIPKGAVSEPVRIGMAGRGQSLSSLSFAFAPSGLVFDPHARLAIRIDNDLVDVPLEGLVVTHFHEDGSSEQATILSITSDSDDDAGDDDDGTTTIIIDVPGFSRYGVQNSD